MILPLGHVRARFKNSIVIDLNSIHYGSFFDYGTNACRHESAKESRARAAVGALLKYRSNRAVFTLIAIIAAVFQLPLSGQVATWAWPWPTAKSGPPVLSSINPPAGAQGTTVMVTLNGSNFSPNTGVRLSGQGARQGNVVFVSPTTLTATFTLLSTTAVGSNNVFVVTNNGNSNVLPFMVTPANTQTVSLLPAQANLLPSGTQTLTATVSGPGNQALNWSLSPKIGRLQVNGNVATYTAPSVVFVPQTVVVTAQSVAQPNASASSAMLLSPVLTLSLSAPTGPFLPSGSQTFTASGTATAGGLTWSLNPNVGGLNINGNTAVYTAPSSITSPQTVTLTVQSNVQTNVTASQTLQLNSPVTLTLTPPTATLQPSGTQTLTAAVGNTANTGVTWSIAPNGFGTLTTSGATAVYTAPSVVNTSTAVTVTAQSNGQPTLTASSTITVNPQITVSVNPAAVTLSPTGTQQFTATVQGTTNTGVKWSLSPTVGTGMISPSGFYTAPGSLSSTGNQTITVTATSVQDTTVSSSAQITLSPGVMFTMGNGGLSSLTYNGQNFLFGPQAAPSFANVYQTDPQGNMRGAGSVPSRTVTDPVANTVTQTFGWGTAVTQYQAAGNKLLITVTLNNTLANPITRYWMFPLALQLPATPLNFSGNTAFSLDAPASVFFDYGSGTIDLADEDIINPMAMSFWQGTNPAGPVWLLSLYVDPNSNLNPNWPGIVRPVAPGGSDTITLSVRFGGAGQTEPQLAGDLFARYATTFPRLLPAAAARKPIARLTFTGRFRPTLPNNPRGWFNDPTVDVTTPAGIAAFQQRLLQAGDAAVAEMTRVGAMGGIIWDLEGQQFDQAFLGDPVQAETISPELVGVLDQFIAKFTNAGFQIGFDIEPQVLSFTTGTVNVSGNQVTLTGGAQFSPVWVGQHAGGEITIGNNTYFIASVQSPTSLTIFGNAGTQTNAPYTYVLESNVPNPEAVMASKVAYTRNRWGATLFYVDKDLTYGGTFITPSQVFEDIMLQYPGTLFFPEWAGVRHFAYTYPFLDTFNGVFEPSARALYVYPQAAGLVRVPDDQNIQAAVPQLIQSVSNGNILLFDGWFQHSGNDTVIQIYQQAP
jgi:hypothetical protein